MFEEVEAAIKRCRAVYVRVEKTHVWAKIDREEAHFLNHAVKGALEYNYVEKRGLLFLIGLGDKS